MPRHEPSTALRDAPGERVEGTVAEPVLTAPPGSAPQPTLWRTVPARNLTFTGRETLLRQIKAELQSAAVLYELDEALAVRSRRRSRAGLRRAAPRRGHAVRLGLRAADITRRLLRSMQSVLRRSRRAGEPVDLLVVAKIEALNAGLALVASVIADCLPGAQRGVVIRGPTDPAPDMRFMSGVRESASVC